RRHGEVPGRPTLARPDSLLRVLPRRQRRRHRSVAPNRLDGAHRNADPTVRQRRCPSLPGSRQGCISDRTGATAPSFPAAYASGRAGLEDVAAPPSKVRVSALQGWAILLAAAVALTTSAEEPGANPGSNAVIPVPLVVGASREAMSALSRIEDSVREDAEL